MSPLKKDLINRPIPVEKITINLFSVNKEFRVSGYRGLFEVPNDGAGANHFRSFADFERGSDL